MKTLRQCSNLEIARLEREWVVMNPNTCTTTKLNETGGYIFSLLQGPCTKDKLIAQLRKSYEEVDAIAEIEVIHFLEQLVSIGLIEHVTA